MAADLGHLEPVDVAQRLVGAGDGVADRVVDPFGDVPTISAMR